MAASRGDPRRRAGTVFATVQSAHCGPGPCRDGLGGLSGRYPTSNTYSKSTDFFGTGRGGFPRNESAAELSRDGSRDALAEVRVQTPLSEKSRSATDPQLSDSNRVSLCIRLCTHKMRTFEK